MFQLGLFLALPFFVLLALNVPVAFSPDSLFRILSRIVWDADSGESCCPTTSSGRLIRSLFWPSRIFVLAGELLTRCDLTGRLTKLALRVVGLVPGGLAHVSVVTAIFFGGISGSAMADAASISPILIPGLDGKGILDMPRLRSSRLPPS